jgi:NAD-dependent dihydropyrimidine dehydrogenase PreA subunit
MACSCEGSSVGVAVKENPVFVKVSDINTLLFSPALCINCGICLSVCPQAVFAQGDKVIDVVNADACMECGACQLNCPVGALLVDSGVGCAAAMINAALTGKSTPSCGGPESVSCGESESACCG